MIVVMMEAIAASWVRNISVLTITKKIKLNLFFIQVYGINNLVRDIRDNLGFEPNYFFRFAWKILCPIIVILLMILSLTDTSELTYGNYVYPTWSIIFGWIMNLSFILPIPIVIIYVFIYQSDRKKTFKQRLKDLFLPTIEKTRADLVLSSLAEH